MLGPTQTVQQKRPSRTSCQRRPTSRMRSAKASFRGRSGSSTQPFSELTCTGALSWQVLCFAFPICATPKWSTRSC
ncbi:hypothetical protein HYQ46_005312 [Verticillium longisporum]|nr:hypothetical protein HYQ46_005312 [Verticillium longisporum]